MKHWASEFSAEIGSRRITAAAILLIFTVACPLETQAQGWFRRSAKSNTVETPKPNAKWEYELAPSAFRNQPAGVKESNPAEALKLNPRKAQSEPVGSARPLDTMSSAAARDSMPHSRSQSVSAPLPKRRNPDDMAAPVGEPVADERLPSLIHGGDQQGVPKSANNFSNYSRTAVRTSTLSEPTEDERAPIGTLPMLPQESGPDISTVDNSGARVLPPMEHEIVEPYAPPSSNGLPVPLSALFWWEADLGGPILRGRPQMPMSLQEALHRSLNEAPELKILHADWYIQMQQITVRDADFDWTTFVNTVWNRDSTPVGSQLDGATDRLRSRTETAGAGLRRLDRSGGQFEVAQQLGGKQSNSQFINPNNQGNSRLQLKYERPLLRGAGKDYNSGGLKIAELDKDIAFDRMQAGIQDHLLATARAYWALVLARGDFLQKVTSWNRAKGIADEMFTRLEVDVTPGTLDRAKSEVSSRLTQSIQSEHEVIAAQEVLLELIYASRYTEFSHYEILTTTAPPHHPAGIDVESQADLAVQSRSEVQQAIREIRAAAIEYNLAKSDVLPRLDLVLSGYSAGLRPNYGIGQSVIDQFSQGEPGAGVGLDFEIPYGNRAAKAAAEQRRIAVTRLQREFETIVGEVKQDVRQAAIRRNKFAATLPQQWETLMLARRLMDYTQTRRDFLADGARVGDLYLNDLLQIQNRLQNAEYQYLQTQVSFAVADNSLMRSRSSIQNLAEPSESSTTYSESVTPMSPSVPAGAVLNPAVPPQTGNFSAN